MVFQNNVLMGASGSGTTTYSINQSIRFNPGDSAYMQRTHGAGGNVDASTISFWFKRSKLGVEVTMFGTGADVYNTFDIFFKTDDTLFIQDYASAYTLYLGTTQVFRDPSAWYHLVFAYDSANAIETERARLYINGQRVTSFGGASPSPKYPSQNADSILGTNVAIGFGRYISLGSSNTNQYFDGYLAEMNYVNGLALDPSSFGEYNDGIWIPKEYSGSYGTGGFFVDGRDSADLGDDESGNGNDLTTSGLAAHDQVADSPTNNFNTMNPLNPLNGGTLSQGNLTNVLSGDDQFYTTQELGFKSYCEVRVDAQSNYGGTLGLGTFGGDDDDNTLVFQTNYLSGYIWLNGGNASANIGGTITTGDVVMMAYDPTTRKWWVGVNGTWRNSGDPANGTGQVYQHSTTDFGEGIGAIVWGGWKGSANGLTVTWNFGQDGTFAGQETAGGNSDGNGVGNFKYSVPSGFLANCTKNLGS